MSAYVVSRDTVEFLVAAAMSRHLTSEPHESGLSWVWDIDEEAGTYKRRTLNQLDYKLAAEVGQMLWDENVKSVRARYPDDDELPGPIECDYVFGDFEPKRYLQITPGRVFKLIDNYEYQSCEHRGWPTSEAHAFCQALRKRACRCVEGYEDAPWGLS